MKIDTSNPSNSCILRLQAVLDTLKPAEHRIAEYILQYPQDVLSSTLNELAVKSGCSYATINRLINRIGYSGFKELKRYLYQDTLVTNSLDFVDVISFSQDTSTKEICENVYNLSSKVLEDSSNIINTDSVDLAANKIISAKKVCVVGTGSSGITARYAYSRLFRIGISCSYDEDTTLFNMHASLLKKGDVLFAVSSSGRSANILNCAQTAKENGACIISLCDYAVSPLSQISDISLFTTSRNAHLFMNIDMPLLIGQIFLIDALHMCCCVKLGKNSSELYSRTKKSADLEKTR
ncbi:MurR/RpiR family transcriptional regulator [Ruminococcus sp. 5_1_39BFAA]|uniref:MurR/RpiR family transcriptional regulator n=1 Tax=Ruminococcus sp. 5_1_39BFAA TaxID=457412 RepID=UPI0035642E59